LITIPTDLPIAMEARLDQRVLLFALGVAALTGILFGLTPALQSTRIDLISSLKVSAPSGERVRRRFTLRNALVVTQVAVSVVVLTTAGLAMRAFLTAHRVDPGFRKDHVLLASLSPGMVRYDAARTKRFYREVLDRTRALPGVEAAGLAQFVPLGISGGWTNLVVDGFTMPPGQDRLYVASNVVDAGFWRAMRAPVVRGRAFDERDTETSPKVAIVNETMARRYWPAGDALGRTIRLRDRTGPTLEVVGIARDGRYGSLLEAQQPFLFLPLAQRSRTAMTLMVHSRVDPTSLAGPVSAQVRAIDPEVPVYDVRSLEDLYQKRAMLPPRLTFQMMASLALIGIGLAVIGLYGVIAYLTARRTHEIGIRMALGAERRGVLLLVVRHAAAVVGIGLALGVAASFAAAPLLAGPFDIEPRNAAVFTLTPALVAAAALAAVLIPARRASRVDPVKALRCD